MCCGDRCLVGSGDLLALDLVCEKKSKEYEQRQVTVLRNYTQAGGYSELCTIHPCTTRI